MVYLQKKILKSRLNCIEVNWKKIIRMAENSCLDYQIELMNLVFLRIIPKNTIVYADPPYSAVHYSRFYHVIETLVRYDHPHLEYKARYRDDRYQSPFDKRKEVADAFRLLFNAIDERRSHLVLSYSDNGLLKYDELLEMGNQMLGNHYDISLKGKNHVHSKMGRADENRLYVNELLVSFRRK